MTRRIQRGFRPDLLVKRREELGLTVPELARLSRVQAQSIHAWEKSEVDPNIDTLKRVARALRKPLTAFVVVPRRQRTLADLRVRAGLTPVQLATAVGISTTFYAQIERGDKQPGELVAKRIAQALRVAPATVRNACLRAPHRLPGAST